MRKIISFLTVLAIISFGIYSCTLEQVPTSPVNLKLNLPDDPFNYSNASFPNHFEAKKAFNNEPENNQVNDHSATLGRVLFYDTRLSINNKVACAGCHFQQNAFSDVKALSTGFEGKTTSRNSLPIFNSKFMNTFFWDSEVNRLEDQVSMPVKDHIEMGLEDADHLIDKLQKAEIYDALFEDAYGTSEITMEKIQKSMAQFIRSIVSTSSKYDLAYQNNFADFTDLERKGLGLYFRAQCNNCHNLENDFDALLKSFDRDELVNSGFGFSGSFSSIVSATGNDFLSFEQANIGLEKNYEDKGVGAITGNPEDDGKFKIPSIRNVMLTAPYMHDGRYGTMDEVLEHYNDGLINHKNLDSRLKIGFNAYYDISMGGNQGDAMKFNFSEEDKQALKAFFNTLTDHSLISDPKYSNPFK